MARQNYVSILQQLLEKLQQKLKKEQLILEQIKADDNSLKRLNQEQQVCLIQSKIKNTTTYLEQLHQNNPNHEQQKRSLSI